MTHTIDIESSELHCDFVGHFPFRFLLQIDVESDGDWHIANIELRDYGMDSFMQEWGMVKWFEGKLIDHAYDAIEKCIADNRADQVDQALESSRYNGMEGYL